MKFISLLAGVLITLAGCTSTPTGKIEAFGLAAASVSDKINDVISAYNAADINDRLVMMAQSEQQYVRSDLDFIRNILIRKPEQKDYALHKANRALGDYAKSLSALAGASSTDALAMAGVNLSKSLEGLNERYEALKSTDADLAGGSTGTTISRVITKIAGLYQEQQRAEAIKEVVLSADPAVQTIGKVIDDQLLRGVIAERLYTMKGNELAGYFADYNASVNDASFVGKKKALDEIYKRYIDMESTGATIVQAQKAIRSVMTAHSRIKTELEQDRFDSQEIFNAVSQITTVHNRFEYLEELIEQCQTEIISDAQKGIVCKSISTFK